MRNTLIFYKILILNRTAAVRRSKERDYGSFCEYICSFIYVYFEKLQRGNNPREIAPLQNDAIVESLKNFIDS